MKKNTKIIASISDRKCSEDFIRSLYDAGMNAVRINTAHASHEGFDEIIKNTRAVSDSIAIILDTKGPEVRTLPSDSEWLEYKTGDIVTIKSGEAGKTTKECILVSYDNFANDLSVGNHILIDDGELEMVVTGKSGNTLVCEVCNNARLGNRKSVNVPGIRINLPSLTDKDKANILYAIDNNIDFIAHSFVRNARDIEDIKEILDKHKSPIKVIAKIENQEGVDNIDEILAVADGVMVARGDLGVDVSLELVPIYQKKIIATANEMGKPVVTATHMLESMQDNPRPTRAEASDVANAILDGTDAIMLSAESASGHYPIEAVSTMVKIAHAIEPIIPYRERLKKSIRSCTRTKNDAIGISVADTALAMNVAGIIAFTQSGNTARRIAKFRPKAPILAVTFDERTQRSLAANWGVTAIFSETVNTRENEASLARNIAMSYGIHKGETIIIVAGYPTGYGATNTMKIIEV